MNPLSFYPADPVRITDTRSGTSLLGGYSDTAVSDSANCNCPSKIAGVYNVTAVPSATLGYLLAYPGDTYAPYPASISMMNSPDGRVVSNLAIVPFAASGSSFHVFSLSDVSARVDYVVDLIVYMGPAF